MFFFAIFIYGHIYAFFGGGQPIRLDMTFTRPTSFSAGTSASAFLVDEDTHGYYIVHQEKEKTAYFIPRDAVSDIVFHGDR